MPRNNQPIQTVPHHQLLLLTHYPRKSFWSWSHPRFTRLIGGHSSSAPGGQEIGVGGGLKTRDVDSDLFIRHYNKTENTRSRMTCREIPMKTPCVALIDNTCSTIVVEVFLLESFCVMALTFLWCSSHILSYITHIKPLHLLALLLFTFHIYLAKLTKNFP